MKGLLSIFLFLALMHHFAYTQTDDQVWEWIDNEDVFRVESYISEQDINADYGETGITMLVYSIRHSKTPIALLLIEKGAEVNKPVEDIYPLMCASGMGEIKIVSKLVEAGAEIGATDPEGSTALFYAASNGNLRIAKYLLKKGASVHHQNKERKTAYDFAIRSRNSELADFLSNYYAKNLPDFRDGPYVKWAGKRKIKAFYMVHDNQKGITRKVKTSVKVDSIPYNLKGFSGDTLNYPVHFRKDVSPDIVYEAERVMVIGDIHGGYDSLLVFLQQNGVIDGSFNWIWENGHLVFVGDIFDRGVKVTEALWLIYRLENQASEVGGAVHLVLGNHELMVLSGNLNYVSDKYRLLSSRLNQNYSLLFGKKTVLGQWLRTKNTILRINDYLFVHAGLSPQIIDTGLDMHEINRTVRYFINHKDRLNIGSIRRETLLGPNGPFWYRGYLEHNHEYDHLSEEGLESVLDYFNARYIFIGHTNVDEITPLYNNRVFAIDVPFYSYAHSMYGLLLKGNEVYLLNTSADSKQLR